MAAHDPSVMKREELWGRDCSVRECESMPSRQKQSNRLINIEIVSAIIYLSYPPHPQKNCSKGETAAKFSVRINCQERSCPQKDSYRLLARVLSVAS